MERFQLTLPATLKLVILGSFIAVVGAVIGVSTPLGSTPSASASEMQAVSVVDNDNGLLGISVVDAARSLTQVPTATVVAPVAAPLPTATVPVRIVQDVVQPVAAAATDLLPRISPVVASVPVAEPIAALLAAVPSTVHDVVDSVRAGGVIPIVDRGIPAVIPVVNDVTGEIVPDITDLSPARVITDLPQSLPGFAAIPAGADASTSTVGDDIVGPQLFSAPRSADRQPIIPDPISTPSAGPVLPTTAHPQPPAPLPGQMTDLVASASTTSSSSSSSSGGSADKSTIDTADFPLTVTPHASSLNGFVPTLFSLDPGSSPD